MIELPEAFVLVKQINETLQGKVITKVIAAQNPHKFAWYYEDPQQYKNILVGQTIKQAFAKSGMVEIDVEDCNIVYNEGVKLRYIPEGNNLPKKHQLLIEFTDKSSLVASIQMYGGLAAFPKDEYDNPYYLISKERSSPLTDNFNMSYFESLFTDDTAKMSLKAFLATKQRIPGLGNGVLQDILFNAGMHHKKKVNTLSSADKEELYQSIKATLLAMANQGGRNTEGDLFGNKGGYQTLMSRNTVGQPCSACGDIIKKKSYMGGSIYFCETCQRL